MKDLNSEYIKNSHNSVISRSNLVFEIGKRFEKKKNSIKGHMKMGNMHIKRCNLVIKKITLKCYLDTKITMS